jgi:hypothetical protein
VTSLALDPADSTGNRLYVGTNAGGVWVAQNAGTTNSSSVVFSPLTDSVEALNGATDGSISIGALTVQPGGTGVILAGTGDPNDLMDSYYGGGILRSADGGKTWTLIPATVDAEDGLSGQDFGFWGEGFAGFAWSTSNPQLVVAAVSQAYEGTLVDAVMSGSSCQGLYYSTDSGSSWHLATITDGSGNDVQGPKDSFPVPDGNAATSVVWNPVRHLFIAAVRYHGYYQSADGVTWTRMASQPGSGLTTRMCPTNTGGTGSIACPVFRGSLAVNPATGDTFAWTVDLNSQDQGLFQDQCQSTAGVCAANSITFGTQLSTAALDANTTEGAVTVENGVYTLALAAVPSQQDTLVLAGADDLWKCSLAMGCVWRNTTNAFACPASNAQVGAYQHALTYSAANPLEVFAGNDSGLWRSLDAIAETGSVCSATDAAHFQNLNGGLGSLAEVESMADTWLEPYTLMAGLGVNGTAGIKATAGTLFQWPQILGGVGGPVAIDPTNSNAWYANSGTGVSIYLCDQTAGCTPAAFGTSPVVTSADTGGDGVNMPNAAPFLIDPVDPTQLLIATCRLWRGPANGIGWSSANAVSPILDIGVTTGFCDGNANIRSLAALPLVGGNSEVVYVGMYGPADGGGIVPGHVYRATLSPSTITMPVWTDLTLDPVTNDADGFNPEGLAISSIVVDPHDTSGNTVYVTVEGVQGPLSFVRTVYRSSDGGAHWVSVMANLPPAPVSSLAVDPLSASTVYVATDAGVYFTTQIASCAGSSACWSVFGAGLPPSPVVQLIASSAAFSAQVLLAATYGRGIWQTPLWTAGSGLTTATASPASLLFASQAFGTASAAQTVTLTNTGSLALTPSSITMTGDFSETDNCVNATVPPGSSCKIQVAFTPTATGNRLGQMTIGGNFYGGQFTVDLAGTGSAAGAMTLTPNPVVFSLTEVGATSAPLQVEAANSGSTSVPITGIAATMPFTIATNSCGIMTLAPNSSCQIQVAFAPTQAGAVAGTLTLTDGAGTQSVVLSGTGGAAPTDVLNPTSLTFPATVNGQLSSAQTVSLTNDGDLPLTSISVSVSGAFQTTSTCGTQLAAHSSCAISVTYAPNQLGAQSGVLTVTDALKTQNVALTGAGVAPPVIGVNPASLTFSAQLIGAASPPQTVTITNSGGVPMANVGFQLTGTAASSYSLGTNTCGATLANGASCSVQVIFTPPSAGGIVAALVVSSSTAGVTPVSVPLNGTGQSAAGLGVSPALLSFATTGVGQTSAAQTVTITNSSGSPLTSVALNAGAPFSLTQNTCSGALAAGATCTVAVVFQPSVAGTAGGALTVSSPTIAAPATVALSGAGFSFTIAISGTSSVAVASGQTANYTVVITPSGAQGSFTFACGTLPANALCLFNPATETLNAGVQGNVMVEIYTGQGTTGQAVDPFPWRELPLACALILFPLGWLPLGWRKRRGFLFFVPLLVLATVAVSSCTSSGGGTGCEVTNSCGQGNNGSTPPGTYTIPVTVASDGLQQSLNVTLNVD